jgi:hypothetical protein
VSPTLRFLILVSVTTFLISVGVLSVLTWQIHRKDEETHAPVPSRIIEDGDVEKLFARHKEDLKEINQHRLDTPNTKFQAVRFRHTIPMLMYAVEIPEGGNRGIVYLGEADAL